MKYIIYISSFLFALLFNLVINFGIISSASVAHAATISLAPPHLTVHVGDTFSVQVGVNAGASTAYTVKTQMQFTPDIITLSTWNFTDVWTVLRQPGYDSFDNTTGTLIRTAGYPSGFTGSIRFGTALFAAKQVGKGTIELNSGSFVYDDSSQNVYTGSNLVLVDVLPASTSTPVVRPVVHGPNDYTFSVSLGLSTPTLNVGQSLSSSIVITNISHVVSKIQVPLHVMILNANGVIVSEERLPIDLTTATTSLTYAPVVSSLPVGSYILVARVEADRMTTPAESQAVFTIGAPAAFVPPPVTPPASDTSWVIIALIIGLIFGGLLAWWIVTKKKIRKKKVIVN